MQENKEKEYKGSGVWFISDIHASHANILKYSKKRMEVMGLNDASEMDKHDEWLINMILSQTKRNDHLYILGDLILANQEKSLKFLHAIKKHGLKLHLVVGNHDKSVCKMYNMFESIDLIKVANFHKKDYPFLLDDFQCVMCHYPIISWFNKARGSCMLHGHTHDNSPHENEGFDLRFNVGLDCPLSNYKLISLEEIYKAYREKIDKLKLDHPNLADRHIAPQHYIDIVYEEHKDFIK